MVDPLDPSSHETRLGRVDIVPRSFPGVCYVSPQRSSTAHLSSTSSGAGD